MAPSPAFHYQADAPAVREHFCRTAAPQAAGSQPQFVKSKGLQRIFKVVTPRLLAASPQLVERITKVALLEMQFGSTSAERAIDMNEFADPSSEA